MIYCTAISEGRKRQQGGDGSTRSMKETTINMIDALRGQQEQLKRLLAQKVLISNAPRLDLSEIEAQVIELKRLLAEFEKVIQDRLQRGQ
jgi:hypothetical protein